MANISEISDVSVSNVAWIQYPPRSCYDCRVALFAEPEGGFSVYAVNLPGVCSQGETEEQALAGIKDSLAAAIGEYLADGEIPWSDEVVEPSYTVRHVIIDLNRSSAVASP